MRVALVFAPASGPAEIQAQPAQREGVRVFLDCDRCDEDYLRKEVTFIDYVRNREDADVHVLVTTQDTGGGGRSGRSSSSASAPTRAWTRR